jgi:hypothetical protein
MKVVINIKKPSSQYHKYNGLTFETRELMHSLVGVLLKEGNFNQTDFGFSEVIIVDFQEEVKRCVRLGFHYKLEKLKTYAKVNRIDISNLINEYHES